MIRLRYSASADVNTNAIWYESETTASVLTLDMSSSFSNEKKQVSGSIISNKTNNTNGGWILLQTNQNLAPTSSGYYDANIFEVQEEPITWASATGIWDQIQLTWAGYKETTFNNLISTERVFVSGSDFDAEYKYDYQNLANFNVYNG